MRCCASTCLQEETWTVQSRRTFEIHHPSAHTFNCCFQVMLNETIYPSPEQYICVQVP